MKLQRHDNGLIAVNQLPVNGWLISFNPDNDRFYIHRDTEEGRTGGDVVHTCGGPSGFRNARRWAIVNDPAY